MHLSGTTYMLVHFNIHTVAAKKKTPMRSLLPSMLCCNTQDVSMNQDDILSHTL